MRYNKTVKCVLLSVLILGATVKKTEAFFLTPPMPWDIEIDIPGNAGKLISNIQTLARQAKTIISEANTQKLEVLKKGRLLALLYDSSYIKNNEKEGQNKTPGKGELANNTLLGLTGEVNEGSYFNAFQKLFLVYPEKDDFTKEGKDTATMVRTAYAQKAVEYRQDVVVETYLTGRVMEDYLSLVEKTIERLDRCQKGMYGKEGTAEHCQFFGLTMTYIEPEKTEPEGDPENSDNAGQYGEMMNAYIVTTVYDRLMRLVEDLTGMEAQFLSAQQLETAEPLTQQDYGSSNQSSAADYNDTGFRFAYSDTRSYEKAKLYDYTRSFCKDGNGCNTEATELKNADDSEILGKLQPIDSQIQQAINLHNLRAKLGEYKSQYRKYLKAKEIHERMLKVLKTSDECAIEYLDRHSNNKGEKIWGRPATTPNDHEARSPEGISYKAILEYQKDTTDKLIGTDSDNCDGFYEKDTCPDGYESDETNPCEYTDANGNTVKSDTMFACKVETVTADMQSEQPKISYEPALKDYENEANNNTKTYNDTDGLIDGTKAGSIETDNRIKAEKGWRIGYDLMMELTQNGTLKFDPWNDQKQLQYEYLRNKYRNIRMIVKAVDIGMMSYRTAATEAGLDDNKEMIEKVLPTITACKLTTDATEDAFKADCTGYAQTADSRNGDTRTIIGTKDETCTYQYEYSVRGKWYWGTKTKNITLTCTLTGDNASGWIRGFKNDKVVNCEKGTLNQVVLEHDQRVKTLLTGGCEYTKTPTQYSEIENNDMIDCPGTWDFSVKYLVNRYMPAVPASLKSNGGYEPTCPGGLDAQEKHLYSTANAMGRFVASDQLQDIFKKRKENEEKLKKMAREFDTKMKSLKQELKETIESRRSASETKSAATDKKNEYVEQRERSLQRVADITTQIPELEARVTELNNRIKGISENQQEEKLEDLQKDIDAIETGAGDDLAKITGDSQTLAMQIGKIPALKAERAYLCNGVTTEQAQNTCGSYKNEKTKYTAAQIYKNVSDTFTPIKTLESKIASKDSIIKTQDVYLEEKQKKIDSLNEEIETRSVQFAKDYLAEAAAGQAEVEALNKKYEERLETRDDGSEPQRMISSNRSYCTKKFLGFCTKHSSEYDKDNLAWTMERVLFDDGSSNDGGAVQSALATRVESTIKTRFLDGLDLGSLLKGHGVVEKFAIANGVLSDWDIADGPYTPATIAEKIKDYAVKKSVQLLVTDNGAYIPTADLRIENEVEAAAAEVTAVMKDLGVDGTEAKVIKDKINTHENYAADGSDASTAEEPITKQHYQLVEDLREPSNGLVKLKLDAAGIDLAKSFGIPENEDRTLNIVTDDDYFSAMPVRGKFTDDAATVSTFGREYGGGYPASEADVNALKYYSLDENDGRDYRAPHRPLLNLPPLREVFYFSSLDYDDVPIEDGKPALSTLVDKKYKDISKPNGKYPAETAVDYLPEVWRYLLAVPNLRDDGKVQQTFIERAYWRSKLADYINNADIAGSSEEHYRAIIGRAGVYPCKLGSTYIDESGGDGVSDMSFRKRSSKPAGAYNATCQEVERYGSGVRHLLADHNAKNTSKSKALQGSLGSSNEPMYSKYSELGQFLRGNLHYRPLLENAYKYLLNDEKTDNNIERQRAEQATFKRNVVSAFLDAVNGERSAYKTLVNSKEDVDDALKNLCSQLHSYGKAVSGECSEDAEATDACVNASDVQTTSCVEHIKKNNGLASTASDDVYEVSCPASGGSYYEALYCQLGDMEEEALHNAKKGYKGKENGEEVVYDGYEAVKSACEKAGNCGKVEERLTEINNYLEAFEVENVEYVNIDPKATEAVTQEKATTAKADWDASREADEESINSMDNQSQAVAYCPVY